MRTNIDLDDALIAEAMEITGLSTKKATVEKALRDLVRIHRQMRALDALEGTDWEGNLDEMRTDWDAEADWDVKKGK
ncbi:type II toxin-antitoxin system VapB family antitoxin [Agrobacterium pusense]|uniref:type II toxin-antitoxin system VapB family antitoxin n=1 Tax=Agrobacterium pusense TaxID=648995 RepID=UPI0028A0F548|nr:type II toxin-antitoxin system VapB family antitoxin [Agrobacterium pusense]